MAARGPCVHGGVRRHLPGLPPLNGFVSEFLIYLGSLGALAGPAGLPGERWPPA